MAEREMNMGLDARTHLFDLAWEDVIISNILPFLSVEDILNLRCTSKAFSEITDHYFTRMKTLRILNKKFSKRTFNIFQRCRKLSSINLCKTISVTDNLLLPILEQNSRLSVLNLGYCTNLTAKCLQPVITAQHPRLTTLKLSRCNWMTNGALDALSFHQSVLENVDLSFCGNLSEHSIQLFLKKFTHLRVLNLEGNDQITDTTLMAIMRFSKNLEVLNIGKCTNITNRGIRALASCPYLRGIRTLGCPGVTTTLKSYRQPGFPTSMRQPGFPTSMRQPGFPTSMRQPRFACAMDIGEVWRHH